MTDDELWAAIDAQRLRTADLLDQLTAQEWAHASLCDGWTVRDVAAHLTLQQMTVGEALRRSLPHLGGVNRVIRETSRTKAAKEPSERFAAEIRGMVGRRRHVPGVTPLETLIDNLVHAQDIAIPLGRSMPMDVEPAGWAATRVVSYHGNWMTNVFKNLPLHSVRLTATDLDWSTGSGPEVRGPISAILLLLTGRTVALDRLTGEGVGRV